MGIDFAIVLKLFHCFMVMTVTVTLHVTKVQKRMN